MCVSLKELPLLVDEFVRGTAQPVLENGETGEEPVVHDLGVPRVLQADERTALAQASGNTRKDSGLNTCFFPSSSLGSLRRFGRGSLAVAPSGVEKTKVFEAFSGVKGWEVNTRTQLE